METQKNSKKHLVISAFLLIFFFLRYYFDDRLAMMNPYSSYYVEIFILSLFYIIYKDALFLGFRVFEKAQFFFFMVLFFSLGAMFSIAATPLQISIPFNFKSQETIFFLLIVAPILEELIFRSFLFLTLRQYFPTKYVYFTTAVVFSLAHFNAYRFIPTEYSHFVFYQTFYTFILGLGLSYILYKFNKSLMAVILCHFFFNLGFYLAQVFGA